MVSLDHGTHSFKGFVQKGSWYLSADFEKNVHKKKLDLWQDKKRWEQLTINISQFTPGRTSRRRKRRRTFITTRRTRNWRRPKEILQMFDAILVLKRDTLKEIVPSGRGDTMLMLLKMMNQQTKDLEERRMIQMKSICWSQHLRALSHTKAMIGLWIVELLNIWQDTRIIH